MSSNLEYARLAYASDLTVGVTFGIYVILAVICIHFLLQRRSTAPSHRVIFWYTVTMLLTGTIWFISGAWFSELELVELPNIIGQFSSSTDALYTRLGLIKNTFYAINIILADSLFAYRLFVIWGRSTLIAVISILVWSGIVATGIATVVFTSRPQANFQASYVIDFQTAFFCLSVSLNMLCTLLIAGRLFVQQRAIKRLGSTDSRMYTSVIIIIVESAALYTLFGIIYIPLMVLQTPVQFPFSSLIGTVTLIAPNLIILRIALKSPASSTTDIENKGTTMVFRVNGITAESKATPASCTTGHDTAQDTPPLTDSYAYNSDASTGVLDVGEGHSSERLVQAREKVVV